MVIPRVLIETMPALRIYEYDINFGKQKSVIPVGAVLLR